METINGEPFSKVIEKLACVKEQKNYESAKRAFEKEIIKYDVIFNILMFQQVGETENIILKCSIIIYDDIGAKLIVREFVSSNEITYKENTKQPINLAQALDKVQKETFRRCINAHFFQMTGNSKADRTSIESNDVQALDDSRGYKSDNIYKIKIISKLENMQGYNDVYKADGVLPNGEQVQLIFWYAVVQSLKQQNKWKEIVAPSEKYILIQAKRGMYKGKTQFSVEDIDV